MSSRTPGAPLAKEARGRREDSTGASRAPKGGRALPDRPQEDCFSGSAGREACGGQACAIGVLVSGEGTNLQALIDAGLPIEAVASSKPGVRALERAERAGIPTAVFPLDDYESREARDEAMAHWLESLGVELVVCAGFMQLLREPFLDRYGGRIVNTHSAPLPDFPGTRPIEDVLQAGVSETAATVHYVDEGVDSGPVIAMEKVPVLPDDTVETLKARVQAAEHRLLPRVVRELCGL